MEYEEVVGRLQKISKRSEYDVENLLGYLFYEDEDVEELLPIEYDDVEVLLEKSKAIRFALHDAMTLPEALKLCMDQVNFVKSQAISTMIVKFIGDANLTVDLVYETFSALEFGMNSSIDTAVLIAAAKDSNLRGQAICALVIAAEEEF